MHKGIKYSVEGILRALYAAGLVHGIEPNIIKASEHSANTSKYFGKDSYIIRNEAGMPLSLTKMIDEILTRDIDDSPLVLDKQFNNDDPIGLKEKALSVALSKFHIQGIMSLVGKDRKIQSPEFNILIKAAEKYFTTTSIKRLRQERLRIHIQEEGSTND